MAMNTLSDQFTTELITPELEKLFATYNDLNTELEDPFIIAKYTFP